MVLPVLRFRSSTSRKCLHIMRHVSPTTMTSTLMQAKRPTTVTAQRTSQVADTAKPGDLYIRLQHSEFVRQPSQAGQNAHHRCAAPVIRDVAKHTPLMTCKLRREKLN